MIISTYGDWKVKPAPLQCMNNDETNESVNTEGEHSEGQKLDTKNDVQAEEMIFSNKMPNSQACYTIFIT